MRLNFSNLSLELKRSLPGPPRGPSAGASVPSLVRELDSTCCSQDLERPHKHLKELSPPNPRCALVAHPG